MIILGENTYFNGGYKDNKNFLAIGAPGSGKSRSFVLPNLCEADNESLVVLDAKNELYDLTNDMMRKKGYNVLRLNFAEPNKSDLHYNPFRFIKNEEDIIAFSNILVDSVHNAEQFWVDCARTLNNALASYIVELCPEKQHSLCSVYRLLRHCTAYEDENRETRIDRIFNEVRERNPSSWALGQYDLVRNSAARTFRSVAISLSSTFSYLMTPDIVALTSPEGAQIDPHKFCKEKTIIYVNISDVDRSKDKLAQLFFTQFLQQLYLIADKNIRHSLPRHACIILDDIGGNLRIPNLDGYISTSRGRNISFFMILQSFGQLKKNYEDITSFISSCNLLFMGSNDVETCQNIATRVNRPIGDVLYKDKDTVFVFLHAQKPITTKLYDVCNHKYYSMLNDNFVVKNQKRKQIIAKMDFVC